MIREEDTMTRTRQPEALRHIMRTLRSTHHQYHVEFLIQYDPASPYDLTRYTILEQSRPLTRGSYMSWPLQANQLVFSHAGSHWLSYADLRERFHACVE